MFFNLLRQLTKACRDGFAAAKGEDIDGKRRQCRKYMGKQGKIKEKGKQDGKPGQHEGTGGAADEQLCQRLFFCIYGKDQQNTG